MNFHMVGMVKIMTELHGMLKTAEESIKKSSNYVMMILKNGKKWMCKGKGGDKITKSKSDGKSKGGSTDADECHYYHKPGHWRRNCEKSQKITKRKRKVRGSQVLMLLKLILQFVLVNHGYLILGQ